MDTLKQHVHANSTINQIQSLKGAPTNNYPGWFKEVDIGIAQIMIYC